MVCPSAPALSTVLGRTETRYSSLSRTYSRETLERSRVNWSAPVARSRPHVDLVYRVS